MLLHAGYGMRGAVRTEFRSLVPRAFDKHAKILVDDEVNSCGERVESSVFGLVAME